MVKIYLTRHGQTEWNLQKRMQGWFDSPLTQEGQQAAIALGRRLAQIPFSAIYASSSGRTVDTAKFICCERQMPIFFKQQLREINVGEWQGLTDGEIKQTYPEQYHHYYNHPTAYKSEEGETFEDVLQRVLPLIKDLIEDYEDDEPVLIVTHAVVKKLLIAHFQNQSIDQVWDPPFIHGTSLTVLHLKKNGDVHFECIGDTEHMQKQNI